MSKIDTAEIARALGAKESEIIQVDDTPGGIRVVTHDGNAYMIVPDDKPDGEGKTGLMLLDPPPSMRGGKPAPYAGTFPVFVNPGGKTAIHAPDIDIPDDEPEEPRTAETMQQEEAAAVTSKPNPKPAAPKPKAKGK